MKFDGGVIPAMLTPFDKDGEVNGKALEEFVDFLIDGGVHGLFPSSTIGEFSNMKMEEKKQVVEIVLNKADGRVPVIPGAGASGTEEALEMAEYVEDLGVDGTVIITPYYLNPDQEGIKRHFGKIAEEIDIPIIMYCNTGTAKLNIDVDTVVDLENEYSNIVGIKDSTGDIARLQEMEQRTSDSFLTLSGKDLLTLPGLLYGSAGGIMGSLNIDPSIGVGLYESFKNGDIEKALDIHMNKLTPLYNTVGSVGVFPGGYKATAKMVTGIDFGPTRTCIRPLEKEEKKHLEKSLKDLGY